MSELGDALREVRVPTSEPPAHVVSEARALAAGSDVREPRDARWKVWLIGVLGLIAIPAGLTIAEADDDPPSIASQCPEQVRMIEAAGIPGDLESGPLGQCASIEQTRGFVNAYQRNMESARQPDDPATKAPSSERWMTGLGDQARYLTPEEVARAEAATEDK